MNGDQEAFEWLVDHYSPFLEAQALYRLDRSGARLSRFVDAADLVQESWFVAMQKISDLEAPDGRWSNVLRALLATIVLHKVNQAFRKYLAGKPVIFERDPTRTAPQEELRAFVTSAFTRVARSEIRREITAALRRLSPLQREVFVLHAVEGRPHAAIAAELERSLDSVQSLYARARQAIRHILPRDLHEDLVPAGAAAEEHGGRI